jgi:hypothetical protein
MYSLCRKKYSSSITDSTLLEHSCFPCGDCRCTACRLWWHTLCCNAVCCTELSPTKVPLLYLILCVTVLPCYHCYSAVLHFPHSHVYKLMPTSKNGILANTVSTSLLTPTMHTMYDSLSFMHVVSGSRRPAYRCTPLSAHAKVC